MKNKKPALLLALIALLACASVLYACGSKSVTVRFDSKGGSEVAAAEVAIGGTAAEPDAPVREGYSFDGWFRDETYGTPFAFSETITADITLYAKWVKVHTVTYATGEGTRIPEQKVRDGEKAAEPNAPVLDGFTFMGWFADESGQTVYSFDTAVTEDITVYAVWREGYAVSFDARGGSDTPTQYIVKGRTATEPDLPEKAGAEFAGWYIDEAFTKPYVFPAVKVNVPATLYARYYVPVNVHYYQNGIYVIGQTLPALEGTLGDNPDLLRYGNSYGKAYADRDITAALPDSEPIEAGMTFFVDLEIEKYTVTLKKGEEVVGSFAYVVYEDSGNNIDEIAYETFAVPADKRLIAWADADGNNVVAFDYASSYPVRLTGAIDADVELYAVFGDMPYTVQPLVPENFYFNVQNGDTYLSSYTTAAGEIRIQSHMANGYGENGARTLTRLYANGTELTADADGYYTLNVNGDVYLSAIYTEENAPAPNETANVTFRRGSGLWFTMPVEKGSVLVHDRFGLPIPAMQLPVPAEWQTEYDGAAIDADTTFVLKDSGFKAFYDFTVVAATDAGAVRYTYKVQGGIPVRYALYGISEIEHYLNYYLWFTDEGLTDAFDFSQYVSADGLTAYCDARSFRVTIKGNYEGAADDVFEGDAKDFIDYAASFRPVRAGYTVLGFASTAAAKTPDVGSIADLPADGVIYVVWKKGAYTFVYDVDAYPAADVIVGEPYLTEYGGSLTLTLGESSGITEVYADGVPVTPANGVYTVENVTGNVLLGFKKADLKKLTVTVNGETRAVFFAAAGTSVFDVLKNNGLDITNGDTDKPVQEVGVLSQGTVLTASAKLNDDIAVALYPREDTVVTVYPSDRGSYRVLLDKDQSFTAVLDFHKNYEWYTDAAFTMPLGVNDRPQIVYGKAVTNTLTLYYGGTQRIVNLTGARSLYEAVPAFGDYLWYLDENADYADSVSVNPYTSFADGTELYGRLAVVELTFDANYEGGAKYTTMFSQYLPIDPVRAGYAFLGWNEQTDGQGSFITDENFRLSDGMTLYAVWKETDADALARFVGAWTYDDGSGIKDALVFGKDMRVTAVVADSWFKYYYEGVYALNDDGSVTVKLPLDGYTNLKLSIADDAIVVDAQNDPNTAVTLTKSADTLVIFKWTNIQGGSVTKEVPYCGVASVGANFDDVLADLSYSGLKADWTEGRTVTDADLADGLLLVECYPEGTELINIEIRGTHEAIYSDFDGNVTKVSDRLVLYKGADAFDTNISFMLAYPFRYGYNYVGLINDKGENFNPSSAQASEIMAFAARSAYVEMLWHSEDPKPLSQGAGTYYAKQNGDWYRLEIRADGTAAIDIFVGKSWYTAYKGSAALFGGHLTLFFPEENLYGEFADNVFLNLTFFSL